jgi:peptide/nickel transport system permease protein
MALDSRHLCHLVRTQPSVLVGAMIVCVTLILAAVGPSIAPFDPRTAVPGEQLKPPGFVHLMGTDDNGMDVFSRVIASPQTDLTIAALGTLGAIAAGIPLGLIAGYYRGFVSELLMRLSDIVQSFPVFILGMALVVVTGQEIRNVVYVVAVVNCPIYVRLIRGHSSRRRGRSAGATVGSSANISSGTRSVRWWPTPRSRSDGRSC